MAIGSDKGSWYVYWNEAGKRRKKYFGAGPVNKARAEKFNEAQGYGKQTREAPGAVLFGQFLEPYLRHLQARNKNEINFKNIVWKCTGSILPFFGIRDVYGLIHADLDDYVIHRKGQTTRAGRPPKQVTINREIDEIQSYLNWCVINRKILTNPLAGYRRPGDDREIIEPPTVAEINAIVEHAAPHAQRFVLLAFYLGARPGPIELGALKWEHVSWEEKTIMIRSADKGGLSSRRIGIHPALLPLLERWQIEDRNNGITCGHLISYKDQPVSSIKKAFARAKGRAGITRRIRPYDIRHAHVTQQLDHGADLKAVSRNVGHKTTDTTIKVYQHVSSRLQREAIELLPEISIKKQNSDISDIFNVRKKKA